MTRRLPTSVEEQLASEFGARLNVEDRPLTREELATLLRTQDVLLPTITDRIDAALLADPDIRVRLIANYGAGVDHIDLRAARAAGIIVTNTPDALTEATAELAILLMLMASRRAGEGERELRAGKWSGWRPTHLVGQGLAGRTLGLVGFGRIAQRTAVKAIGLGMDIVYLNRSGEAPGTPSTPPARFVPRLEEVMAQSDIVSLHVPGGDATLHLVDRALLAHARPDTIIINTSRGPAIDETALADALDAGRLGSVGLDVYEREPSVEPRLVAHPRAVLLPHLGSATIETRTAMGMQAITNIQVFVSGGGLPNRVA